MSEAEQLPVCIIGAGSSGVTTAKSLRAQGVAFECLELGSKIGGMWRYENDNGMSSAYQCLHSDTSRKNLGYSDFPIPETYPDFLSHGQVLEYLETYAEYSGVVPYIRFNTRVEAVRPRAAGGWTVALAGGEQRDYRAVIVANGHLWDPRMPEFAGTFSGMQMHSHHYRTPAAFADKDVLVVGIGNSAVDIAVDVCRQARSTTMSMRRTAWVVPKYIMGIPTDRWIAFLTRKLRLPTRMARSVIRRLMVLAVGDQARFGLPRPLHPIWREHATLSQDLLSYLGHGWITIKPNILELQGDSVQFDDGSRKRFDAIIYATGYRTSFPFLDPATFAVRDGHARLYRRILPVDLPGLYFVGLVQPIGPTIPLCEIQGQWIASVLAGRTALPDAASMDREIDAHLAANAQRYVGSARYTLEVDFRDYAGRLRGDMRAACAGA